MRPPRFWQNPPDAPGWQARALAPASALWRLGGRLRAARARPFKAPVPVVCVGNLTAGGAGKTPLVAALAGELAAMGHAVHVLSRGYGGTIAGPHRVNPVADTAAITGDEPLLHALIAPTWVARDRGVGARAAAAAGASVIVMDDGFQNPALVKDIAILAVDAADGFGNRRVIPAGPLREPLAEGLARADVAVLIGLEADRAGAMARWPGPPGLPVIGAEITPVETGLDLRGQPVVAFAGIGKPEKFFDTLRGMGADLVDAIPFDDHYNFPVAVLNRLTGQAKRAGAALVTTEKDAVRLPAKFRREVMVLPVRLQFADDASTGVVRDLLSRLPLPARSE